MHSDANKPPPPNGHMTFRAVTYGKSEAVKDIVSKESMITLISCRETQGRTLQGRVDSARQNVSKFVEQTFSFIFPLA